jgi:hypothetical protein
MSSKDLGESFIRPQKHYCINEKDQNLALLSSILGKLWLLPRCTNFPFPKAPSPQGGKSKHTYLDHLYEYLRAQKLEKYFSFEKRSSENLFCGKKVSAERKIKPKM